MLWNKVLTLVAITETTNAYGEITETETRRKVACDVKSIRHSEFYEAYKNGLKPELEFDIRECEYNNEERIEYNGTKYSVIRTYTTDGEIIELVAQRDVI